VSVPRKKDSDEIKKHIANLKRQPWLGPARSWWPDFLFRFDDIESAAKVLNVGALLSRSRATADGVMGMDCASSEVLARTADNWKQYVRLYFRPRTPMQYDIEGIRPKDQLVLNAHCPVPVVMLFNSVEILTRADTRFSDGNLAAHASVGNDARFLETIPFKEVYHNAWFEPHEKASIIFHRHAEVIVPHKLDLLPLKYIVCRT
jgi:ssDNA thymidine ADP-ribosyltransferase, DarT